MCDVPRIFTVPLPLRAATSAWPFIVTVWPFTSIGCVYTALSMKITTAPPTVTGTLNVTTLKPVLVTSPVSVSAFPLIVYPALNVIGPTLVPAGKSFVITLLTGSTGNSNESALHGTACGDQFCTFDQFAFTAPVHVSVAAKHGAAMMSETRHVARRQNARRMGTPAQMDLRT